MWEHAIRSPFFALLRDLHQCCNLHMNMIELSTILCRYINRMFPAANRAKGSCFCFRPPACSFLLCHLWRHLAPVAVSNTCNNPDHVHFQPFPTYIEYQFELKDFSVSVGITEGALDTDGLGARAIGQCFLLLAVVLTTMRFVGGKSILYRYAGM